MGAFKNHGDCERRKLLVKTLCNLLSDAFLVLESSAKCIDYPSQLRYAHDSLVGNIRNMSLAKERQKVMLA